LTEEPSFAVTLDAVDDVPVVRVTGELDLAGVPRFERMLARAFATSGNAIIDLSRCTFIDSSGIGAILQAHRRLGEREGESRPLPIVTRDPGLIRTLDRIGIDAVATLFTELSDALRDSRSRAAGREN
jgi:anti-anti-sigma factor